MVKKTQHYRPIIVIIVVVLFASGVFVFEAYEQGWSWTGFSGKKLWDWLQLLGVLAIPVMGAAGAAWFSYRQTLSASQLAADRQQEDALQAYIDKMSELLLKEQLSDCLL